MAVLTLKETRNNRDYGKYGFTRSGHKVDKWLYDAVQMAAKLADWGPVYWVQGGLHKGVAASARTHWGLNVGDLSVRVRPGGKYKSIAAIKKFVKWLMRCGVIGFIRGFVDRMSKHIHCVGIPANHGHDTTTAQLYNRRYGYKYGGAGLAGAPGARWWGPARETMVSWGKSKYNPANKPKPLPQKPGWYVVDPVKIKKGHTLLGLNSKGGHRTARGPGFRLYIRKVVRARISKDKKVHVYGVTNFGTYYNIAYLNRSHKQ